MAQPQVAADADSDDYNTYDEDDEDYNTYDEDDDDDKGEEEEEIVYMASPVRQDAVVVDSSPQASAPPATPATPATPVRDLISRIEEEAMPTYKLDAALLRWSERQQNVLLRSASYEGTVQHYAAVERSLSRLEQRRTAPATAVEAEDVPSSSSDEYASDWSDEESDDEPLPPPPPKPPLPSIIAGGLKLPLGLVDLHATPPDEAESRATKLKRFSGVCSKITDRLYLGSDVVARDLPLLRAHAISHVVNAAGTACPDYHKGAPGLAYHTLHLYDSPNESLAPVLYGALDYIEHAIECGGSVFVHCQQGVSRSSSIVIAYLMYKRRLLFSAAHKFVKDRRGIAEPNAGFICALLAFHERLTKARRTYESLHLYRLSPHFVTPIARLVEPTAAAPLHAHLDPRTAFVLHVPAGFVLGAAGAALLARARSVFVSADADGNGEISRPEFFAKLRADDEFEGLLNVTPINGVGVRGVKAMGKLLVELDADADDGRGEGLGSISWIEFERAVMRAQGDPLGAEQLYVWVGASAHTEYVRAAWTVALAMGKYESAPAAVEVRQGEEGEPFCRALLMAHTTERAAHTIDDAEANEEEEATPESDDADDDTACDTARDGHAAAKATIMAELTNGRVPTAVMYSTRDTYLLRLSDADLRAAYTEYTRIYLDDATKGNVKGMAEMVVTKLGELVGVPYAVRKTRARARVAQPSTPPAIGARHKAVTSPGTARVAQAPKRIEAAQRTMYDGDYGKDGTNPPIKSPPAPVLGTRLPVVRAPIDGADGAPRLVHAPQRWKKALDALLFVRHLSTY